MKTQKISASTQKFIMIEDIVDNIVLLQGKNACVVIEVTASNFALLSKQEQEGKIYSYAAFLNSLTFPIQILIRNKRVNIANYIKDLEDAQNTTKNSILAHHIQLYKDFIQEMIKTNVVLNKKFYIVIPFSYLEAGVTGVNQSTKTGNDFLVVAKRVLQSKLDSVHAQLRRLTTSARTLNNEELVKLFYDIYNDDVVDATEIDQNLKAPLIRMLR